MPTRQVPLVDVEVKRDGEYVVVSPIWGDVDRPNVGGIQCRPAIAPRLVRAIKAGAVYADSEKCVDVNGATYARSSAGVLARMLNADLRRLGY